MKIAYLLLLCSLIHATEKGIVLKAIVDTVGHPIASSNISYHNLPAAALTQEPLETCPRSHQLLYNETVEIIKQVGDELLVKIPHLFYVTTENNQPQSSFWTHKKNIVPIRKLNKEARCCIPKTVDRKHRVYVGNNIVTLSKPWYNDRCGCTFSVGTRFVCAPYNNRSRYVHAYAIHPATLQPTNIAIPRSHAIIIEHVDRQAARDRFVNLLQSWVHMPGTVAYVWGGCSLTETLPSKSAHAIKIGFDCTGLILRAAQAAGMPYYYKNSTTVMRYLQPIVHAKDIQEGDLIWIQGHIMAIADLKKNTVIEARHYSDGYGKLHEIKLNRLFKDIETFADLFDTIAQQKPLYRLNNKGQIAKTFTQAKMLAIDSCWDHSPSPVISYLNLHFKYDKD